MSNAKKLCAYIINKVLKEKESIKLEIKGLDMNIVDNLLAATSEACECGDLKDKNLKSIIRASI
ncbi:MAG: hypothetical protein QXZ12_08885, partial [Thermoplasmata archaeon]